ncbi:MAG: hypothetical protein ABI288_09315 [Ginsengibacter sp.]
MKYLLTLCLFGFTMCNSGLLPAQNFSGSFKGNQNGISSSAVFIVKNKQITGTVILDGKSGQVTGTVNGNTSTGTLYDSETQKNYTYTGKLSGNELHFSMVFPELNDQEIELIMQRETAGTSAKENTASANNNGTKNPALIGLWSYTEVLSSGSGDNYGSFSTEYFMEFKADGTMLSWTGRSAGSSADMGLSSEGQSAANAVKVEWYTEGKNLFLVDPGTKEKVSILFFAEENRMMLHNGGKEKKVLHRVQ